MKVYTPGRDTIGAPLAHRNGEVRLIRPSDIRACIEQFRAEGGMLPACIIIAGALLNPNQGHPAFQQKYRLVSPGFLELARELEGQDLFLKGEAGVLGWEVRVGEASMCHRATGTLGDGAEPLARSPACAKLTEASSTTGRPRTRPGPRGKGLDKERLAVLVGEGKSSRVIAAQLQGEGLAISPRTVARRMAEQARMEGL